MGRMRELRIYIIILSRKGVLKGGRVTHNLAFHSHMTIDIASLQSRDGARWVFAGPGPQSITKPEAP